MEAITKKVFEKTVVNVPNRPTVRRFVGWQDFESQLRVMSTLPENDGDVYPSARQIQIEHDLYTDMWDPATSDREYNLVFSLCTDGTHRPVMDIDYTPENFKFIKYEHRAPRLQFRHKGSLSEVKLPGSGNVVALPSTHFLHVYYDFPMSFDQYIVLLNSVPGEDARKYATNVYANGYGALRPPWVKKYEPPVEDFNPKEPF